jgi:hypothetical protein
MPAHFPLLKNYLLHVCLLPARHLSCLRDRVLHKRAAVSALLICCLHTASVHGQDPAAASGDWPNFYANRQAELLLDQGRAALREDDHDTAVRVVADALQIIRINHGLRSPLQIEPLQLLIAAHLQGRDWQAADKQIDYFRWLNTRNYSLDFAAYLSGSEALSDLLLTASADPQNPLAARYLVSAKNQNWRTISAIEARRGKQSPTLIPWLYRVVQNHYQQSALIRRRGLTSYDFHSDADALVSGFRLSRNTSLDMSYNIGQELLERIATLAPANTEARALAAVHQADWELLYGQHQAAQAHYQLARQWMQEGGRSAAEIEGFFNRPVIIPEQQLQLTWPADAASRAMTVLAWSPLYPGVQSPLAAANAAPETGQFFARLRLASPRQSIATDSSESLKAPWRLEVENANPDQEAFRELIRRQAALLQFRPLQSETQQWYSLTLQLSPHFIADESLTEMLGLNADDVAISEE